ncbi:DoxX family protein [Candidatus Palauibacter sp.]|uniref:DoxX family protein n=1 Tax=Candidatus Palauibacter sp. TaxID=3101350 RepID=UPI003AF26532
MKLAGLRVEAYAAFGYPALLQYVVGAVEVVAGLLLFGRVSRFYGAILVILLMVGAIFTLGREGEFAQIAVPLVWLLLALFV